MNNVFITGKTKEEATNKAVAFLREYYASHFDNEFDTLIYHDNHIDYNEFIGGDDVLFCFIKEMMMIKLFNVENKPLLVVIDSLDEFINDRYFNMRMEEIIKFSHVRFLFVGSETCKSNKIIKDNFKILS